MISRALILQSDKVLLIHRYHNNQEYYVLPGGHRENNESEEETLLRELKEETGLDATIDRKLWTIENPEDNSQHHFFLVKEFSGSPVLGGEELEKNSKNNQYILERHDSSKLDELRIVPEQLKQKIISFVRE